MDVRLSFTGSTIRDIIGKPESSDVQVVVVFAPSCIATSYSLKDLFGGNIKYALEDLSDDEIEQAIEKAATKRYKLVMMGNLGVRGWMLEAGKPEEDGENIKFSDEYPTFEEAYKDFVIQKLETYPICRLVCGTLTIDPRRIGNH